MQNSSIARFLRPSHSRVRFALAMFVVIALVAAGCGDDDTTAEDTQPGSGEGSVLGPQNPASGEPVEVGMISNGRTEGLDNQIELDVAEATVEWLNTYQGGIGGRPYELVTCVDNGDPGKAIDCANEMIQKDVAAVVIGSHAQLDAVFAPLDEAGLPVMVYAGNATSLLEDTDNGFILTDPNFPTVTLPLSVAEEVGASMVTGVIIDVPAALDIYQSGRAEAQFDDAGIELEIAPVPLGTADMTPQMQTVLSGDPGVVHVLGNDSFCISAFQALNALSYDGEVTAISQCLTDATRTSVPPEFLDGMRVAATSPVGSDDPSVQLYETVMEEFADTDIDTSRQTGLSAFIAVAGFGMAVQGLDGEPTHENILSTIEAMPVTELPGSGGLMYQCNRQAVEGLPAVCTPGGLQTVLDAEGQPGEYKVVGNDLG